MDQSELCGIIESILFVAGEAVAREDLAHALDLTVMELDEALEQLARHYDVEKRGLKLNRFGDSVQLTTRPEYAQYIERLLQPVQKQPLSQAMMETLSIVAYRQPVTKAEVEAIRGVKCDYSIQSLSNKQMICELGRKEGLGRPILYGTTEVFLQHFGIESLEDLPELNEYSPEDVLKEPLAAIETEQAAQE